VESIVPGVYRIELPLPYHLDPLNVYLLRSGESFTLIDAGMDTPQCFAALDHARQEIGSPWTALRELTISHYHPDHVGMAPRLLRLSGARLRIGRAEAEMLGRMADHCAAENWERSVLREAGTPAPTIDEIERAMHAVRGSFHPLRADLTARKGEKIPCEAGDFEVVLTPGHSPEHLCLFNREQGLFFSGDHLLEKITPNIQWHPERDALGEYLESLRVVAKLDIDLVLPSHGRPFRGHREWIDRAIAHHAQRCDQLEAALRQDPKATPFELTQVLWTRRLSPFHLRFAIFETLAHLEHLRRRG
jgi:glyoxylase-like metal-dependent hydrolase (beta-lactamase superfamily II)